MPAFFQEVFARAGVDDDAKPYPDAIAALGNSSFVRLAGGSGLRLDTPRTLSVEGFVQALHSLSATRVLDFFNPH